MVWPLAATSPLPPLYRTTDGGESWRLSQGRARLATPRGMQEPCAVELTDGRVRLLARTGAGFIYTSLSADGSETWSTHGAGPEGWKIGGGKRAIIAF